MEIIDLSKESQVDQCETYENICCICLEPFTINNIYVLKCNHFLCTYCFDKLKMYQFSLFQDVSCPQCRNIELCCHDKPLFIFRQQTLFQDEETSYDVLLLHELERHVMAELYQRSVHCMVYVSLVSFFFIGLSTFVYWLTYCSKNPYASVCLR